MKIAASILATALCTSLPLAGVASDHSGGGGGGGGSHSSGGSSGGSHSSAGSSGSHSAPASHPAPAPRALPPGRQPLRPPGANPVQPLPIYRARTPVNPPSNGARPIPNPNNSQPWGWNGGTAWIGYSGYWGNGFWGPLAYGLGAASYVVAAGSPGAQLLLAYQLTQTPCGPPNLVEIYGPDGSEICAFPNALVAPGQYYIDPDTLTLYSGPPQN